MFSHPQTQELEASEARLLDAARLIELHSEAVDKALLVVLAKANIIQAEEEEPELLAVQDETQEMLLVA